jgi:hypothetical protein
VLSKWGKQCKAIKDRLWFTAVSILSVGQVLLAST